MTEVWVEVAFCMQINLKVFYRLVLQFLVVWSRHAQIAQMSRVMSKKGLDGLSWIFTCIKTFIKAIKIFSILVFLCRGQCSGPIKLRYCSNWNTLWTKCEMGLIFCILVNLKVFYEFVLRFLMGVIIHAQLADQRKLKSGMP